MNALLILQDKIKELEADIEIMQASQNNACEALRLSGVDIIGKTIAESIRALCQNNKDLATQSIDRGQSYEQAIAEIKLLQEKSQRFHDLCHEFGIPNGVMPYRVDWLRNYINKLKAEVERLTVELSISHGLHSRQVEMLKERSNMGTEIKEALLLQDNTIVELGEKFMELICVSQELSEGFKASTPDGEWAHLLASFPPMQRFIETVEKLSE